MIDAKVVAIFLPKNPSYDAVASALALKLSLEQSGKSATVTCPDPMTVEFNRLVGVDSITSNFASRNLIITFPGQTEIVDKVSYNVDNGELQLIITPKSNTSGIDHSRLKFISGNIQADLIILLGSASLPDDYKNTKYISFTDLPLCQAVTNFLQANDLPFNSDIASNLLSGLEKSTSETVAFLTQAGAKRQDVYTPDKEVPGSVPSPDWFEPKVYSGTTLS